MIAREGAVPDRADYLVRARASATEHGVLVRTSLDETLDIPRQLVRTVLARGAAVGGIAVAVIRSIAAARARVLGDHVVAVSRTSRSAYAEFWTA